MTTESNNYQPHPTGALVPSGQWLAAPLQGGAGHSFWVWFFPPTAPHTIAVQLPWEQLGQLPAPLSLFSILRSLNLQPAALQSVQMGPQMYPVQTDFAVTAQLTGPEGMLSFVMAPASQVSPPVPGQMPQQTPGPTAAHASSPVAPQSQSATGPVDQQAYKRADADWKSTMYLESQAATLRKQLAGTMSRLTSLNKDLPADDKRAASRQDIADWQDARRFLRDATAKLSRYMKEYDLGVTSSAGRRNWMETNYEEFIRPRKPFPQMDQMLREFESYRKVLQHLVNSMSSAQAFAVTDGETRAKQVLSRVQSSARSSRTKSRGKR